MHAGLALPLRFDPQRLKSDLALVHPSEWTPHYNRSDTLEEADFAIETLAPSGFIFHSSRCGSTLVAQVLAALPCATVLSEPPVLDQILQAHLQPSDLSFDDQVFWLRRIIIHALGQRRTGSETHYFLKLDSWHIHRLPLLRAAFPKTPCLFLFRDPLETLRSHAASPGLHALPGAMRDPRILGLTCLTFEDIPRLHPDKWCARVLSNICASALNYCDDPQTLFIDYTALPDAVFGPIARHFSLALDETDAARMRDCTHSYSKDRSPWPQPPSEPLDSQRAETLRDLSATVLAPLYAELRKAAEKHTRNV